MKTIFFLFSLIIGSSICLSQPGTLDLTFGDSGRVVKDLGFPFALRGMTVQPDDKIVMVGGGNLGELSGASAVLIRYLADGRIDSGFASNGVALDTLYETGILAHSVDIQTDGKIIVAGYTWFDKHLYVSRSHEDGTRDDSFGWNGRVIINRNPELIVIEEVVAKEDGKILLAGHIEDVNEELDFLLYQFQSNGDLDSTFGNNGIMQIDFGESDERMRDMIIQPDGKIVVCGRNAYFSGNQRLRDYVVARFHSNGSIDSGFGNNGVFITDYENSKFAWTIGLQSDGKIVVGAKEGTVYVVLRFSTDGILDTTFGDSGRVALDIPSQLGGGNCELLIQPNDKIVVTSGSDLDPSLDFATVRFLPDGDLDSTFGDMGIVTTDFDSAYDKSEYVVMQSTGKIIVGGTSGLPHRQLALARYLSDTLQVGISPLEEAFDLSVFPNPLKDKSILQFELDTPETLTMYIIDQWGRLVHSAGGQKTYRPGIHQLELDTSSWSSGIYFLIMQGEDKSYDWLKMVK